MEYRAHDLPVTGLAFAPGDLGTVLGGYDLLAGSADYKITLLTSQGKGGCDDIPGLEAASPAGTITSLAFSLFVQTCRSVAACRCVWLRLLDA